MGKKRQTAKTGDKAIYGSRNSSLQENEATTKQALDSSSDHFHRERDQEYLNLDGVDSSEEQSDDGILDQEGVMDLGAVDEQESSAEESSDGSDSEADANPQDAFFRSVRPDDPETFTMETDDESSVDLEESDPRRWGHKKSAYHGADTADLELGQEQSVSTAVLNDQIPLTSF